jgi:hypothetical protein
MATTLPSLPPKRHQRHAPWRKQRSHDDPKYRIGSLEAVQWKVGSAEAEARSLLVFMRNTNASYSDMVQLITLTDGEYKALCEWAGDKPTIAVKIDDMMVFREKVLLHFKGMLEL